MLEKYTKLLFLPSLALALRVLSLRGHLLVINVTITGLHPAQAQPQPQGQLRALYADMPKLLLLRIAA
ncbi:hypothetical protein ACRS1R_20200 [Aeromonas dhakensis]|uniref:hypothetical protein n=1 Tax=Aeromonas dhakensis TaxID=196024 RepID=UPI003EDF8EA4